MPGSTPWPYDADGYLWAAGQWPGAYTGAPCTSVVQSPFLNSRSVTSCGDPFARKLPAGPATPQALEGFAGNDWDMVNAVLPLANGGFAVAGTTRSRNLPITSGAIRPAKDRTLCTTWSSPTAQSANACADGFIATFGVPPSIDTLQVLHGGSQMPGPLAPGELVVLQHSDLIKDDNAIVNFDEIQVPVLSSTSGRALAAMPYAVAGRTRITVTFQNLIANIDIGELIPSVFGIVNADGLVNGFAKPGSIVALFGTGIPADVQVWVGGLAADVQYAGPAPGMPASVQQLNFKVPDLPSGSQQVFLATGTILVTSQSGVNLTVAR